MQDFEWHKEKALSNLKKHKVDFEEAVTVFDDLFAIYYEDNEHSKIELRFRIIGYSKFNRLLSVTYTDRQYENNTVTRIINARLATKNERKNYESKNKHN
jgi:uncharacterized protein